MPLSFHSDTPKKPLMDIKGLARNILPLANLKPSNEAQSARSKTDADNDRDGNGQSSGEERKREKLTPEEIADAAKYLEGLQGVKDNGLTVRVETVNDITVVFVQDRYGKVVRRIPESELHALTSNREKKSGNLLNKAL